jgi:hypothetical protein
MDLFSTLSNIIKTTSNISYINSGGCGVFAYYLGKKLDEFKISYTILYLVRESHITSKHIKNNFTKHKSGKHNVTISSSHIMIYVNGKIIDGEGVYDCIGDTHFSTMKVIETNLTLDELKYALDFPEQWNPWYYDERFKYNPIIEKAVNRSFNKLKKLANANI